MAFRSVRGGCGREKSDILKGGRVLFMHELRQNTTAGALHFLLRTIDRVQKGFSNRMWPILLC